MAFLQKPNPGPQVNGDVVAAARALCGVTVFNSVDLIKRVAATVGADIDISSSFEDIGGTLTLEAVPLVYAKPGDILALDLGEKASAAGRYQLGILLSKSVIAPDANFVAATGVASIQSLDAAKWSDALMQAYRLRPTAREALPQPRPGRSGMISIKSPTTA